ncbi:Programmed cell death protein 7 [Popillia japonica]|uniref:Programmed cell death protein 7 n=1 Tax=Popillia japonica TaxID=7064 RepID=A0AAW1JEN7_POPJA
MNSNPNSEYINYDMQANYYNYNVVKYQQPSFHTVDPRLNFVNKAPTYVNEQIPQVYYPENKVKYDLTLQPPEAEIEHKTDDELYIETWLSKIGKIQINLDSTIEIIATKKKSVKKSNRAAVKLTAAKQSLKKCLNIIKKLETIQEELKNNVETLSSADWKKKTIDIGNLKAELSSLTSQFDNDIGNLKAELSSLTSQFDNDHFLASLKRSVTLRKKKRLNQQKAREAKKMDETLSSADWKKKTIDIGNLKAELSSLTSQFDNDHFLASLKRSVTLRKKKRLNQQKAREAKKMDVIEKKKAHKRISDSIDNWLENMKEEVEKAKMEEKMQKDADCVLAEVTMKKSDARKQLSLISALIKLRNIRENVAVQRGEKVSLEDRAAFNKLTEKLTNMWEDTMKIYLKEEQCLKLMLETSVKKFI